MRVCALWRPSLFAFVVLFVASLGLLGFHNALIDARRASLVVQGDAALRGHAIPVRLTVEDGEPIVSVAVPIRRSGVALAVLLLSTPAGA